LSSNYLQKLKKDYELRVNVLYLNDYQQQKGFTNTQFFCLRTIDLLEENTINLLQFFANKFYIQNNQKIISKNSLSFKLLG
jgi:hypothetical protein